LWGGKEKRSLTAPGDQRRKRREVEKQGRCKMGPLKTTIPQRELHCGPKQKKKKKKKTAQTFGEGRRNEKNKADRKLTYQRPGGLPKTNLKISEAHGGKVGGGGGRVAGGTVT